MSSMAARRGSCRGLAKEKALSEEQACNRRLAKGERAELSPERAGQIRADVARANVLLGPAPSPEAVRFLRSEKVDNREADVIEVQDVGGGPVRLYIDLETRDLLKIVYVGVGESMFIYTTAFLRRSA